MTTSTQVNEFCHYATAAELAYLRTLAAALPAGASVMMLGAGPGVMMMSILENNPGLIGYIIDHDTCQWAERHLAGAGLMARTRICDSAQAGHEWTGPKLALLIIDADHSYEGVKRDCAAWLQHLAPSGFVFFHDYDASETEFADQEQYPGVQQAVDELLAMEDQWLAVAMPGTGIVYQKAPFTVVIPPYMP